MARNIVILILFLGAAQALASPPLPVAKPGTESPSEETVTIEENLTPTPAPYPKAKPLGKAKTLNVNDRALYKKIFAAQEQGEWDEADEYYQKLSDLRLRGHILYQRLYHPIEYRSSYEELAGWMALYADHPGAHEIYKLASQRKGNSDIPLRKDEPVKVISGMMPALNPYAPPLPSQRKSRAQRNAVLKLERAIQADLRRDRTTISYGKLQQADGARQYMSAAEYDAIQAQIAGSYLYYGKRDKALELANKSIDRSGKNAPLAGWIAGLASWMDQDYENAYRYFQIPATSNYASTWTKAAGAFWASRAALKLGRYGEVSAWLNRAADYNRTFYGILAIRALGRQVHFNWTQPPLTEERLSLIESYPQGLRAKLLIEAGQPHLASRELLRLHPGDNKKLQESLLAFAAENELPSFEIRFAHVFRPNDGQFYDASLYPLGSWVPKGGYKIDKAFIHALVRQESRFNHKAENGGSKAIGLMQILPSTANGVVGSKKFSGRGRHALKDPVTNITIGQKYLLNLKKQKGIDNDIFALAIAYNAGPGNFRRWKKRHSDIDDPLLFVEMIPVAETRAYVERTLSNYWIYRMRMNLPTPSLDAAASGKLAYLPE